MGQKIITDKELNETILRVIKEGNYYQNPQPQQQNSNPAFAQLEDEIGTRVVEIKGFIEAFQEKIDECGRIMPALNEIDKEIKSRVPNIKGPIAGKWPGEFRYQFAERIPYNQEEDSYGEYDSLESDLEDLIPREMKDFFTIYVWTDDNYAYKEIEVSVTLPEAPSID